jgi:hypothetical protein
MSRARRWWLVWSALSLGLVALFGAAMWTPGAAAVPVLAQVRGWFQPGPMTHGHHQIELACEACHTKPFGGAAVLQDACMSCHGAALKEADDKHPASKFEDPRNAFRLERIDAVRCVSCHVEHRPETTHAMGVTQPDDYCAHCHSGKDEMPADHAGFRFDGCASAGCHNYHDNRALYEDFLLKHAGQPETLPKPQLRARALGEDLMASISYPQARYPFTALDAARADAPPAARKAKAMDDWLASRHAQAGVNCSACHVPGTTLPEGASAPAGAGSWVDRPATPAACQGCHGEEARDFQGGLHGMRLAQGLGPMRPALARLPMRADAGHADPAHAQLDCSSCHAPHRPDLRRAAVEACLGCHADEHTRAYEGSPHHRLWQQELRGEIPAGRGVSCASCHMPRDKLPTADGARYGVQHNQSATLQPNEKMLRPVCLNCHGLGFAIDALADAALVERNFAGRPARHVESIDMAVAKDRAHRAANTPVSQPERRESP